ncbi:MAG: HAD family hydrolase [Planctomycetota bacterium]
MPAIRAVTFDMDGLMFNTEDVYTLVGTELLGRRGYEFTSELKNAMMGIPPQPTFEMMIRWHDLTDTWEVLRDESNTIFLDILHEHLALMPGLEQLLGALEAAGVSKGIATSSGRQLTTACLAAFALEPRFRFVLTSEDIHHGKPDPEIYLLAAERHGVRPEEMLVLEDSHNGCKAAAAAGAYAVAVPGPHSLTHDFSMARLMIESLADPRLFEVLGLAP